MSITKERLMELIEAVRTYGESGNAQNERLIFLTPELHEALLLALRSSHGMREALADQVLVSRDVAKLALMYMEVSTHKRNCATYPVGVAAICTCGYSDGLANLRAALALSSTCEKPSQEAQHREKVK